MGKKGVGRRIGEERIKKEDWRRKDPEEGFERGGGRRRIGKERIQQRVWRRRGL